MSNASKSTPMMAQYQRIKQELPKDALLFFRLGDFYEMFFDDAKEGARLLNVALTKRGDVPMCGVPYHAADNYIARLLKAGKKIAICDQVEEARPGKLVKRDVTRIISPGTHFDERMLQAERNNYLASVCRTGKAYGFAVVDLTTGDFKVTELKDVQGLSTELQRLRPAEVIFPGESQSLHDALLRFQASPIPYEDWVFSSDTAQYALRDHFGVASLDGFGLKQRDAAIGAAGGVVHYLTQNLRRDVSHLTRLRFYQCGDYLALDSISLRNLEILEPLRADAPRETSLYGALNRSVTPMGARRLRDWLTQPLSDRERILRRQAVVRAMVDNGSLHDRLRAQLKEIRDVERMISRLSVGSGNARDLHALRTALDQLPAIKQTVRELIEAAAAFSESGNLAPEEPPLSDSRNDLLRALQDQIKELPDLSRFIAAAIVEEPSAGLKEGGMIREGFDAALDELKRASREGKDWIARMQSEESERTGIQSLKIRFNSVFGYYIEVTKSNLEKVPERYVRKQTVANGERYITPELKEVEGKILGAEEKSVKLEYELFLKIREKVIGQLAEIQQSADALAQLDVLGCFAEGARLYQYCRPDIEDSGVLDIRDGRHPVLEQSVGEEPFVPNDLRLLPPEDQIALITGPNMAGKSTYIRQAALLTLMAHTGSFVPAQSARVGLVDRIFTRIGASDDLSRGQSTFMVEMSETANILNNATDRSLVILDEIGRGTSTFDGLSLAWSIVEHLHNQVGAKTLFATHYHELSELAGRLPRVKNFNVAVREWNDEIVFLRKIVEGGTDKSYGIQVARLAGVPKAVVHRAKEILRNLEESELTPEGKSKSNSRHRAERERLKKLSPAPQLDLFLDMKEKPERGF